MNLLDTLLFPIIYCDVDDFRYFGLEFLNRCVDHSEGLSHSLFLLLPSLLFFEQFCFRISYLPVDSRRVYWGIIKCATVSQIFIVEYCWNKWRIFWTIWYTLILYIEEYCIAYLGNMYGQFDADDDYLYSKHMLDVWPLWLELQLQHRRILVSMCSLFQFKWWYHTYLHCLNIRCGQYLNDLMSWLRCRVSLCLPFHYIDVILPPFLSVYVLLLDVNMSNSICLGGYYGFSIFVCTQKYIIVVSFFSEPLWHWWFQIFRTRVSEPLCWSFWGPESPFPTLYCSVLLFFYILNICMPMRESKLSYILMMLPSLRTKSDSRHYIYYLHYAYLLLYILLSPSLSLIKFSMINFL
jgi:hypothetical protein